MEEPQAKLFISMEFFKVDSHGRAAELTLKDVRGFLENSKNNVNAAVFLGLGEGLAIWV